jgi:hypothetical protein
MFLSRSSTAVTQRKSPDLIEHVESRCNQTSRDQNSTSNEAVYLFIFWLLPSLMFVLETINYYRIFLLL